MQTMRFVMFENGFQFTIRKYLLLTIFLAKDILTNPIWNSRDTKQTNSRISKVIVKASYQLQWDHMFAAPGYH